MNEYKYVSRFDKEYPQRLNEIIDPPAGLYIRGRLPDPNKKTVAIIGSRICSEYGRKMAEKFAKELSQNDIQIISGLARGIDGIAQKEAALSGGESFGILGCGIDVIYPKENEKIYDLVLNKGGIISEYGPGLKPQPFMFPLRNRIISGLADLILVIEAKRRSGTSITVNRALEQGKDVYAVPGRIYDECSVGCNELIAQGAGIANTVETILNALGIDEEKNENYRGVIDNQLLINSLSDNEKKIYAALEQQPMEIETLMNKTGLSITELFEGVTQLMMRGLCRESSANCYCR